MNLSVSFLNRYKDFKLMVTEFENLPLCVINKPLIIVMPTLLFQPSIRPFAYILRRLDLKYHPCTVTVFNSIVNMPNL